MLTEVEFAAVVVAGGPKPAVDYAMLQVVAVAVVVENVKFGVPSAGAWLL